MGSGMDKSGLYTVNSNGELVGREGNVSVENTIYVYSGSNPLSLVVVSDFGVADCGGRFYLGADLDPAYVAPVVVGVAKDFKLEVKEEPSATEGREAAAPKTGPELLTRVRSSISAIFEAEQQGKLPEGTTAPLMEMLRTHE